ncbi:class I SAM-dependent methyltransferase [Elusimicrobiota bacterium]
MHIHCKRKFFDEVSKSPDPMGFRGHEWPKVHELEDRLGDLTGLVVLEPGCGAGPLTRLLGDWVGASGRVVALDSSPGMVAACREAVGARPNVEVRESSLEEASLPASAFDLVLCFRMFPHIDDKGSALRRFADCLKPDGRLVIAHIEGREELDRMHAEAGIEVGGDIFPKRPALEGMLAGAGFRASEFIDSEDRIFVEAVLESPR